MKTRISRDRTGFTLNQTLSGVTTKRIVTRRLPHHKRLNVSMLTAISVSWFTKPELERYLFPRISVQVEPERVEPFWMKRIRRRQSRIGIHGHRHHRLARWAVELIKIAEVETRFFPRQLGIEMM